MGFILGHMEWISAAIVLLQRRPLKKGFYTESQGILDSHRKAVKGKPQVQDLCFDSLGIYFTIFRTHR